MLEAGNLMNLQAAVFVAGVAANLVGYPLDTVRARMALSHRATGQPYPGVMNCLTTTIRRKNLKALYAGFWLSVFSNQLRLVSLITFLDNPVAPGWVLLPLASIMTYPIELIRRKMQVNDLGRSTRFGSTREAIQHTRSAYGLKGLLAGSVGSAFLWAATMQAREAAEGLGQAYL